MTVLSDRQRDSRCCSFSQQPYWKLQTNKWNVSVSVSEPLQWANMQMSSTRMERNLHLIVFRLLLLLLLGQKLTEGGLWLTGNLKAAFEGEKRKTYLKVNKYIYYTSLQHFIVFLFLTTESILRFCNFCTMKLQKITLGAFTPGSPRREPRFMFLLRSKHLIVGLKVCCVSQRLILILSVWHPCLFKVLTGSSIEVWMNAGTASSYSRWLFIGP